MKTGVPQAYVVLFLSQHSFNGCHFVNGPLLVRINSKCFSKLKDILHILFNLRLYSVPDLQNF